MTKSDSEAFMRGLLQSAFQLKSLNTANMTAPELDFVKGLVEGSLSQNVKACSAANFDASTIDDALNVIDKGDIFGGLSTLLGDVRYLVSGVRSCNSAVTEVMTNWKLMFNFPPFDSMVANVLNNLQTILYHVEMGRMDLDFNKLEGAGDHVGTLLHIVLFGKTLAAPIHLR